MDMTEIKQKGRQKVVVTAGYRRDLLERMTSIYGENVVRNSILEKALEEHLDRKEAELKSDKKKKK